MEKIAKELINCVTKVKRGYPIIEEQINQQKYHNLGV